MRSYCWERAAEAIVAGVAMGYAVGGIDVTRPASPGGGGSGSRKRKCLCGRCAAARGEKRVPMVPIREEAVATKPKKWWQRGGGNRVVATDGDEGAERNELRRRGRHLRTRSSPLTPSTQRSQRRRRRRRLVLARAAPRVP